MFVNLFVVLIEFINNLFTTDNALLPLGSTILWVITSRIIIKHLYFYT